MYIEYAYKDGTYYFRNTFCKLEDVYKYVKDTDFYTSWCIYDSTKYSKGNMIGNLVFDLDSGTLNDAYKDCKKLWDYFKSIGITDGLHYYFSGAKGFHFEVDYRLINTEPINNLAEVYKLMAQDITKALQLKTVDTKVYESRRLWRYPNTINSKSGLYCIKLSEVMFRDGVNTILKDAEQKHFYSIQEKIKINIKLNKVFNAYRFKLIDTRCNNTMPNSIKINSLPCINEIINTYIPEGSRNNTGHLIAVGLKCQGYTREEAFDILRHCLNKDDEEKMCHQLIASAYNKDYTLACKDSLLREYCNKDKCGLIAKLKNKEG